MRLFTAISLSPEAIERLTRLHLRLSSPGDGLRWSTSEQWHITLQFHGEVGADRAACLAAGLAQYALPTAPEVILEDVGQFAAKGILYASVQKTAGLQALQTSIVALSSSCGFIPESRPFRPHITLARCKGPKGFETLRRFSKLVPSPFGQAIRWDAHEVLLLESTLRPQGAEYTVRASAKLPLAGSPRPEVV